MCITTLPVVFQYCSGILFLQKLLASLLTQSSFSPYLCLDFLFSFIMHYHRPKHLYSSTNKSNIYLQCIERYSTSFRGRNHTVKCQFVYRISPPKLLKSQNLIVLFLLDMNCSILELCSFIRLLNVEHKKIQQLFWQFCLGLGIVSTRS